MVKISTKNEETTTRKKRRRTEIRLRLREPLSRFLRLLLACCELVLARLQSLLRASFAFCCCDEFALRLFFLSLVW